MIVKLHHERRATSTGLFFFNPISCISFHRKWLLSFLLSIIISMDTLVQWITSMKSPQRKKITRACMFVCVCVFRAYGKNRNACIHHVFAHAWNRFPQKKKNGRMVMCKGLCVYMCIPNAKSCMCVCGGVRQAASVFSTSSL